MYRWHSDIPYVFHLQILSVLLVILIDLASNKIGSISMFSKIKCKINKNSDTKFLVAFAEKMFN